MADNLSLDGCGLTFSAQCTVSGKVGNGSDLPLDKKYHQNQARPAPAAKYRTWDDFWANRQLSRSCRNESNAGPWEAEDKTRKAVNDNSGRSNVHRRKWPRKVYTENGPYKMQWANFLNCKTEHGFFWQSGMHPIRKQGSGEYICTKTSLRIQRK